jgi:adenine deaminase
MDTQRLLAVARGDQPADLVLRNLRLVDVFSGTSRPGEIAVCGTRIAGIGPDYKGKEEVDLQGRWVCPGLIDAHVHIESSLVRPREYGRAAALRGVTTVIANPHEIANVFGVEGVRYMARDGKRGPCHILLTVPSSVPATPLATSGAALGLDDLARLREDPAVVGLGEVMDYSGVIAGKEQLFREIGLFRDRVVDGHCPGLTGRGLAAYIAAGISSDHECTTAQEARSKLQCGMRLFLREGSAARNLRDLLPVLTPAVERRLSFCTDDLSPGDLLHIGSIDHMVRLAVKAGVPPMLAIRMATLNPAEHFRLEDRGRIAPGCRCDLVVVDNPLDFRPFQVYQAGRLVAQGGELTEKQDDTREVEEPERLRRSVAVDWRQVDLTVPAKGERIRVIGLVPDQLVTRHLILPVSIENGRAVADPQRDLLKLAVVERHRASGRVGLGFVKGFGLRQGALAGTVAHDHHNLVAVGADDRSMLTAARAVAEANGGLAVAVGEQVLCLLPLPIAGLMSDLGIEEVARRAAELDAAAGNLGTPLRDPFMTLSFLALEVIPDLKLTDRGLVDVQRMQLVPLFPAD